jgi:hypothetical protein
MQKTNETMELIRNTRHYLSTNSNIELGLSKDDLQHLIFLLDQMLKSRINDNGIPSSINNEQLLFIDRMISNNAIDRVLRFRLTDIMSVFDYSKAIINMETSHNVNFNNNAVIDGKIKQLEKRQSVLLKELDEISKKNAKILSDYERKITLLFNKKTEDVDNFFSERTRSETERLNKYETDITEVINNAQHAINARAHESEKNLINSMNVAQVNATAELSELTNNTLIEINKRIKNEISIFVNANKQLNKLLSTASNSVLAKDNLTQAERERKTADRLRGLGVLLLFCAVMYIACEIIGMMNTPSNVNIENVMIRVIITFVLMLPSIYLLKESSRHRADERKFRKTGINLATIDSYLANFDDASKVDIKRQLTANFFDNGEQIVDYSTVPDIQAIVEKTIDSLMSNKKEANTNSNVTQPKEKMENPK